jgi:hypothetical protein
MFVYFCSSDIEGIFSSNNQHKLKKLDTFLDALTYMLTEGVFLMAAEFLEDYKDHALRVTPGTSRSQSSTPAPCEYRIT